MPKRHNSSSGRTSEDETHEKILRDLRTRIEGGLSYLETPPGAVREGARRPMSIDKANTIVYGHSAELNSIFKSLTQASYSLYKEGLGTQYGGREGVVTTLKIIELLLDRIPMETNERVALIEPLRRAVRVFEQADDGYPTPECEATPRPEGRPSPGAGSDPRRNELRVRCVLAAEALDALGYEDSNKIVASRASGAVKLLNMKFTGAGFSADTIRNWRRRQTTSYRQWSGNLLNEEDNEFFARDVLELDIALVRDEQDFFDELRRCGQYEFYMSEFKNVSKSPTKRLEFYSQALLESLATQNLDRPVSLLGPAKSLSALSALDAIEATTKSVAQDP
jgi:hypothetical protein